MKYLSLLLIIFLLIPGVHACKDIIATHDATAGDYSLLLKVRDPSRPGLQVLCMVNEGYSYTYHHPWSGKDIQFITNQKYIGVATEGDIPPNDIKVGMALNEAGIAYGDADVPSYWVNPSPNAWDDFDWIRYSCQNASNEEEAVNYLIDVVEMHAPGVAENLFVVGPNKSYIIEADALHAHVREVNGAAVMSNYPKELWSSVLLKKVFISSSFDKTFEGEVRRGSAIRLGSLLGVKVLSIENELITARQIPFGETVTIREGEGKKVGTFYVQLLKCYGRTAKINVRNEYYAWENEMIQHIQKQYGLITLQDMMNWSRLHSSDLKNLRGMCEEEEKCAMIFKISNTNSGVTNMGWFAPDQCAAIFVPIHIASEDIAFQYQTGEAAELAKTLLRSFGHGKLSHHFQKVEQVFIIENENIENFVLSKNEANASIILTLSDIEMQNQAYLMQEIYLKASDTERKMAIQLWENDYASTLKNMEKNAFFFQENIKKSIALIASSISKGRAEIAKRIINDDSAMRKWEQGNTLLSKENYEKSISHFVDSYEKANVALFNEHEANLSFKEKRSDYAAVVFGSIIAVILLLVLLKKRIIAIVT